MENKKTLYQRIQAIMQDVQYLSKDDRVDAGKGRTYKAISEEKVTSTVRESMVNHGVVIIPVEQTHTRTDEVIGDRINRMTTVDVKYRIQNVDNPDDFIIATSSGTGVDTQDKGVGKAMTYAYKYLLLRTFAIPTGEDPDKISSDLYTEELNASTKVTRKDELRRELIDLCKKDAEKANAAAEKRFGKNLMKLSEDELQEAISLVKGRE